MYLQVILYMLLHSSPLLKSESAFGATVKHSPVTANADLDVELSAKSRLLLGREVSLYLLLHLKDGLHIALVLLLLAAHQLHVQVISVNGHQLIRAAEIVATLQLSISKYHRYI